MKLIRLEIINIASIENALIDFTSAPLKDEPLFLICGETGAGKSTILDAICLALYNDTPRFASALSEKISDDGVSDKDQDISVSTDDPRQFLRRGTGGGSVRLEFSGNDSETYTALWAVRRAKGKPDGRLQSVAWSLESKDGIETLHKEVRRRIESITGMTFAQFCRTSMLAQGEFSRFLKSSEAEKADILEKLTKTDIYSRIGARIFAKAKEKKEAYLLQKARTESITLMTEDEKNAAELSLKENAEVLATVKEVYDRFSGYMDKFRKKEEYARAIEECMEAEKALDSDYCAMLASDIFLKGKLDEEKSEARRIDGDIRELEKEKSMIESVGIIVAELEAVLEARKNIEDYRKETGKLSGRIADAERLMDRRRTTLSGLQSELETMRTGIKSLREDVAGMDKPGKTAGKTECEKRKENLREAAYAVKDLMDKEKSLAESKAAVESYREQLSLCRQSFEQSRSACETAEKRYAEVNELYECMKTSVESWAKIARSRLRVGDTCPLCASRIGRLVEDTEFENMLAPVRERYDKAHEERDSARRRYSELRATVGVLEQSLAEQEAASERAESARSVALTAAVEHCSACSLDPASPDIVPTIKAQYESVNAEILALEKEISAVEELERKAAGLQGQIDDTVKRIGEAESIVNASMAELSSFAFEKERLRLLEENTSGNMGSAYRHAESLIGDSGWKQEFESSPQEFLESMKNKALRYSALQDSLAKLSGDIAVKESMLSTASAVALKISTLFPAWGGPLETEPLCTDWEKLHSHWIDLLSKAEAVRQRSESLLSLTASVEKELCDIRISLGPESYDDAECRRLVESELSRSGETQERLNQEIGAIRQRLEQDRQDAARVGSEKLREEELAENYREWSRFSDIFGDLNGRKFKKIAQSHVLKELLRGANLYLEGLSDRYRLDCMGDSLTITVRDLYQGGLERSVNTLSGGETFLVSLSLALGLSSLGGGNMNVGILFIDEGFGTLSDDYLNAVMEALENLHRMGGRKVGIISHVEALRERIPTQIRVLRTGNSSSRVDVRG